MRWDGSNGDGDGGAGCRTGPRAGHGQRLLVADRQPLVTAAVAALLTDNGHHVVATAHDGAGAQAAVNGGEVDLALLDIDLADPGPVTLLLALQARGVDLRVIILAPSSAHPGIVAAIDAGVAGLVLKSESAELLRLCLGKVVAGGRWIDSVARSDAGIRSEAVKDARLLTRRERDVARLVATGQRNRAIAGSLGISEGTVKMHLHNVYAKLGLESRTQLAMDERLRMQG